MISIILIFLSGILNACVDIVKYHWDICIFTTWPNQNWINPSLSWPNKWKPTTKMGKFIMSTALVWVTDFWHFCKFLMLFSIMTAIVLYVPFINWWVDLLILYSIFTITFELFFSKLLVKHKNI